MNFIDLIFPKTCFGCKMEGIYICSKCLEKASPVKPFCPVCCKASIDGMTHAKCISPLGLDGLISIWKFDGAIRKAIISIKYNFVSDATGELSELTSKKLKEIHCLKAKMQLVPIPLHKSRERWRGFNQSEVIGKTLAADMGWEFWPKILVRKSATKSQTELERKDRGENVRGAFAVNSLLNKKQFDQSTVLLFDDVWTTGSTMKEACKVLKRNGAKTVWGLAIAS